MSKRTISSVIRGLITEGLSNEEIWSVVSVEFNMPENHKHYPQWYRSEMARKAKTVKVEETGIADILAIA